MIRPEVATIAAKPPGALKSRGAFYTDPRVADFLVWWAVRSSTDRILDPSSGEGVFLRSASQRLIELGGTPHAQVLGIEIDQESHEKTRTVMSSEFGLTKPNVMRADFFDVAKGSLEPIHVIVGNPPFVRYQRFSGAARSSALARAAAEGVRLNELCSSWAPFLVHSVALLQTGGRLAMVVPMALGHAAYALPVMNYLSASFEMVTFLTFQKKLFRDLSEDTLLLLADNKGGTFSGFATRDLKSLDQLADLQDGGNQSINGVTKLNPTALCNGKERLIESFLPKKARSLYRELRDGPLTHRLGELADVGIGYVTGANDFFHLRRKDVELWQIPAKFLRPAICRGRGLAGMLLRHEDWLRLSDTKDAGYLLAVPPHASLPQSVSRYLDHGQQLGVAEAYKCRARQSWFSVPHVHMPDALLTYMSGKQPRLVANDACVVATNSLHVLRVRPLMCVTGRNLAVLASTSLTRLSAEIEGHSLGGGMLKLEPTEAERMLVPSISAVPGDAVHMADELDVLFRSPDQETARERADEALLKDGLGLSEADCRCLREAAMTLESRRLMRGRNS